MKQICSLLLTLSLLACLILPAGAADVCFEDISGDDWYYTAVRQAYERGFMDGVSDSSFDPYGPVTRGEFVAGLGRVAGITPSSYIGDTGYSDVPESDPIAPFVTWAGIEGIVRGAGTETFDAGTTLTLAQFVAMVSRTLTAVHYELPVPDEAATEFSVLMDEGASADTKLGMLRHYGVFPSDDLDLDSQAAATRAQAASVLVWINNMLWDGSAPVVNLWQDYVPLSAEAVPEVDDPIVSAESIVSYAEYYGLAVADPAFEALCSINTVYASQLGEADRAQPLVFLFEGVGATANPGIRMDAMCVVVDGGEITYLNLNSSTIPDDPFDPKKNDGTPMPTLRSGIYDYVSVNQTGYAALNVLDAQVVRFYDRSNYYTSTSVSINIHRRNRDTIAPASAYWGNSVGCCLIGVAGAEAGGEYADFITSVGLVPAGSSGDRSFDYNVSGRVVVDRSFAWEYLRNVGYTDGAIDLLG